MKTWHKVAMGAAAGFAAGVVVVNLAAVPTFGVVGKLYDRAQKAFGKDWRAKVLAGQ